MKDGGRLASMKEINRHDWYPNVWDFESMVGVRGSRVQSFLGSSTLTRKEVPQFLLLWVRMLLHTLVGKG